MFVETDSPNLGKSSNAGVKDANDMFIQDFAATYKVSQRFMLDAGLLLMEQSYNHNQSAATLLSTDYGPYTFVESGPFLESGSAATTARAPAATSSRITSSTASGSTTASAAPTPRMTCATPGA